MESLDNLLTLVTDTSEIYDKYLSSAALKKNSNNMDNQVNEKEMNQKIETCTVEYYEIMTTNIESQNNNNIVHKLEIQEENKKIISNMISISNVQNEVNQNIKNLVHLPQFDLKYTKLSDGSTIDCDNKHIKIGSKNGNCYGMILADKQNVQGYKSGQHCFRMYYKNPKGPNKWLFFGLYKYGIVPKDEKTYRHETSWGIVDYGNGQIHCNGKYEFDKSNMSFLYSLNENEIDMFVDLDKGILSYSIVDDNVKNRKYTFKKKFETSIAYAVHLNVYYEGTEVQIAKIDVNMFGKNKKLVQWPITKY